MLTIIIPARGEEKYLNRTIANAFETCAVEPEVIVIDNGGNGQIDPRAKVIDADSNLGERKAMNQAVAKATNPFILRIDAHCDFSPKGWDVLMCEVTGEKDITVAVLTALNGYWEYTPADRQKSWLKQGHTHADWPVWQRIPGHWYGLARMIVNEHGGIECKWQTPNRDHSVYKAVEPNMGLTGCGFLLRKSFYELIGGADEDLPLMGAIGEEFAIKAWHYGGKVQTRTDVIIGHVFGATGVGYNTTGVITAQQKLNERYGACLEAVAAKFPGWDTARLQTTHQHNEEKRVRTVTVKVKRVTDTKDDATGQVIRRRIEKLRYVWLADEHPDEADWTDEQIRVKYEKEAQKVGEEVEYPQEPARQMVAVGE